MTETLPEPKSRKEEFLAKAAGMDGITLPEPASREELYLNAIAEGGGGGGESTDAVKSFDFTSIFVKGQEALDAAGATEATFSLTESEYTTAMTALNAGKTARVFNEQEGGKDLFIATGGGTVTGESWLVTITLEGSQYMFEATESEETYSCTITEVNFGGGGVTPVQTTGTSTTDVMSQDATTKMIFPDIANNPQSIVIGASSSNATTRGTVLNGIIDSQGTYSIAIGDGDYQAHVAQNGRARNSVAIGGYATAGKGDYSIALGYNAYTNSGSNNTGRNIAIGASSSINGEVTHAVSLGAFAKATRTGEVNIGTNGNSAGYNSTDYRVIGGVHDGQDTHDAVTVGQVNGVIDAINTALSTNIPHIGA